MPTVVMARDRHISREQLQAAFLRDNIDARVFFHPLSSLPMFSPRPSNVFAWDIPTRAINLPSFHDISPAEISRVATVIEGLCRE
jgi:perosamine synthetase